jgi:diadenylate cyclase
MALFSMPDLSKLRLLSLIDILAVALLIYNFIIMVRGRRAAHVLNGIWMLLAVYLIAVWAHLDLLRWLLAGVAPYTAIALIVMFQAELRRVLARIGRIPWVSLSSQLARREIVDDIIPAVVQMAESRIGALIVVERDIGLRTFIESGVSLDARVSRDLLLSIFERGGALHDGAVIIQGDRVAAAACFLPLTMNPTVLRRLGTRHRAAIGITEDTDALAIVVSEETGQVSLAVKGVIEPNVSIERVRERLTRHAGSRNSPLERSAEPEWRAQS